MKIIFAEFSFYITSYYVCSREISIFRQTGRVERIVARVEAGPRGVDTRFVVTSLADVRSRTVYRDIYCARGQAENHIKAFKGNRCECPTLATRGLIC